MHGQKIVFASVVVCLSLLCMGINGETGVSAKFRNLTNRKLRVFWVNHMGEPYLNGIVPSGKETSFASYVGHRFFWAEMHGPEEPLHSTRAEGVHVEVDEEFLLYTVTDSTTTYKAMEKQQKELKFLHEYKERTGRQWLSMYPRDPPIFAMYPAKKVGDTYPIRLDDTTKKWLCADQTNPACRTTPDNLQVKVLSIQPRAFIVEGFVNEWEADHVIEYHRTRMSRSTTGNGENQREESRRTSLSSRMTRNAYPLADTLYRRLAAVLNITERLIDDSYNAEPINIVYYQSGQEYTPHFDTGTDGETQDCRFISALLYFSNPDSGGHTSFPKADALPGSDVDYLRVPAKKGNLLFFYNLLEDGNLDEYSLHAGEPVGSGEKWIGAAWIWEPRRDHGDINEIKKIYLEGAKKAAEAEAKYLDKEDL